LDANWYFTFHSLLPVPLPSLLRSWSKSAWWKEGSESTMCVCLLSYCKPLWGSILYFNTSLRGTFCISLGCTRKFSFKCVYILF
jgi:hypothetical protein